MPDLRPLERDVIQSILANECPDNEVLRQQFEHCTVVNRKYTGVGFFTDLAFPEEYKTPTFTESLALGKRVDAQIKGLKNGAGFVPFVTDGKLELLEGYCYDEQWPDDDGEYVLEIVKKR